MQRLITMGANSLNEAQENLNFNDRRISEMLFRYRARNFPNSLKPEEKNTWQKYCQSKLIGEQETSSLTLNDFRQQVISLQKEHQGNNEKENLLNDLNTYADKISSEE